MTSNKREIFTRHFSLVTCHSSLMALCPIAPDSPSRLGCENLVRKFLSQTGERIAAVWGKPPYRLRLVVGRIDAVETSFISQVVFGHLRRPELQVTSDE